MKKSKFTDEQIVFALKQAEGGTVVSEITDGSESLGLLSIDGSRSMGG